MRDFIHEALYHPQRGYFARGAPVVGHLGDVAPPIDFAVLRSRDAYYEEVQRRYAALQSAWLTPAEILSPHYGAAVAAFAAARHDARFGGGAGGAARPSAPPLRLYELGAGTGTLARDALGWLRAARPDVYARARYTAVEISAPLAALQAARVGAAGHGAAFAVAHGDAAAAATWAAIAGGENEECLIVATEVLDNLPHDRVWRPKPGAPWRQTHVRPVDRRGALAAGAAAFEEVLAPAADQLVLRCLAAATRVPGAGGLPFGGLEAQDGGGGWAARVARALARAAAGPAAAAWLPTGAAALLAALRAARPRAALLVLDFDMLPEVAVAGAGAPLVSATRGGAARDRVSYLLDPGSADIFFPTDFRLLRELYLDAGTAGGSGGSGGDSGASSGARNRRNGLPPPPPRVEAIKAAAFFARWAPGGGPAAADGFRPLLEDYSNTAALVAEPAPAGGALAWM